MEHIRILLLGVSFWVYMSYQIPRPHGTYTHTSIRGFIVVYISYKIRSRQKVEKIEVEMAETREVRRGFTFLTDFSKNSS
jgi:hypothetical protein